MSTNPVITSAEARKITGGRTPLVPVQYEQAVTALQACIDIDDAKSFADKADALATWAKIYHDDKVDRQARLLKLHAYRRMGELARELRPKQTWTAKDVGPGNPPHRNPGARALLIDAGIGQRGAQAALNLSQMSTEQFQELGKRPTVPMPATLTGSSFRSPPSHAASNISMLAAAIRNVSPGDFLKSPPPQSRWRENGAEVYEWLGLALRRSDRSDLPEALLCEALPLIERAPVKRGQQITLYERICDALGYSKPSEERPS